MIKYRNTYRVSNDVCYIDCYNRCGTITGTVLIDADDLETVSKYQWHIEHSRKNLRYAQATIGNSTIRIHRLILHTTLQIDHINHNGLDNRKSNLRVCINQENNFNKLHKRNPKSGYTGIRYNEKTKSYYVRIMVNRKEISLGHYKILEDALEARKQGEIKYFGKFRYNGDAEICRD